MHAVFSQHLLRLGVSLASSTGTIHASDTSIDALFETQDAWWFSSPSQPELVFYFPKTQVAVEPGFSPAGSRLTFAVRKELRKVQFPSSAAEIYAPWKDRAIRPYTVTGSESCTLAKTSPLILVVRQIDSKDRRVSGASPDIVCQWSFNLEPDIEPAEIERIRDEIESGQLFQAPFSVAMDTPAPISWALLHQQIVNAGGAEQTWTASQATQLAILAVSGISDWARLGLLGSESSFKTQFTTEALTVLFTGSSANGYQLRQDAPTTSLQWAATRFQLEL